MKLKPKPEVCVSLILNGDLNCEWASNAVGFIPTEAASTVHGQLKVVQNNRITANRMEIN